MCFGMGCAPRVTASSNRETPRVIPKRSKRRGCVAVESSLAREEDVARQVPQLFLVHHFQPAALCSASTLAWSSHVGWEHRSPALRAYKKPHHLDETKPVFAET